MASQQDPYSDPETGVLRNLLEITDPDELEQAETSLVVRRAAQLLAEPLPGSYDLGHLQAVHHHLFQDVYDWAGQPRTVIISKYGQDLYALPQYVRGEADRLFGRLKSERHLQGLGLEQTVERLADYMGDLHAIHPFREGNSRSGRALWGQLAAERGVHIPWGQIAWEPMEAAKRQTLRGEPVLLRELLLEHAQPIELPGPQPEPERQPPAPLLERVLGPRPARQAAARSWDHGQPVLDRLATQTGLSAAEIDELQDVPAKPDGIYVEHALERLAELRNTISRFGEVPEPGDPVSERVADLAIDYDLDR